MSFLERHWWIGLVGSLVSAAAMVIAPVLFLQQMLPVDKDLGKSLTPEFLGAGVLAAVLFALLVIFARSALRGRRRARLRAEALRGNLAVMPVSQVVADATKAPDISVAPLMLWWQLGMTQRFNTAPALLLMALFWGFVLALAWGALIFEFPKVASLHWQWLLLVGLLVATPGYAALMVVLIRYLPTLFGRPFGLTASNEGIFYRTALGREGFIRWEEMKLLEVEQYGLRSVAVARREFTLYGESARQVAIWKDNPPAHNRESFPNGMSQSEMTVRLQALLHLINARTGLVPRTFSKALRSDVTQSASPQGRTQEASGGVKKSGQSTSGAFSSAVIAVVTLAIAAAVILLPMSSLFVLNVAVASSLVIVSLLLIVYAVRLALQRLRTSHNHALPPIASTTWFSDRPQSIYALSFGLGFGRRLRTAVVGLLLLVDIAPMFIVWLPLRHVSLIPMHSNDVTLLAFDVVLSCIVGFYGVIGIALLIRAFWSGNLTVRADRSALLFGMMSRSITLPWESIERITAQVHRGEVVAYVVVGDVGRTRITWLAEPSVLRAALPLDGAIPIAPDELAALAAQRSGKGIEVEGV